MRAGRIVEAASTLELFEAPKHDYTKELLSSVSSARRSRSVRSLAAR
jgi:ABC-type dipeptide/oligopeptide/nickel transport system ATPase component